MSISEAIVEIIRIVWPFISVLGGALIGVLIIPLSEMQKRKFEINKTISNLFIEIDDIRDQSKDKAIGINSGMNEIKKYRANLINTCNISGLGPINQYFITESLSNAYGALSKDQRTALKAMLLLIKEINNSCDTIQKNPDSCDMHVYEYCIECSAALYYITNQLLELRERFVYTDQSQEYLTKLSLDALGIKLNK